MEKLDQYQHKEEAVVSSSNAVVEPTAVVVKITCAPVTPSAVLGISLYVAVAPLTVPLILIIRKLNVVVLTVPLTSYNLVTGINPAASEPQQKHHNIEGNQDTLDWLHIQAYSPVLAQEFSHGHNSIKLMHLVHAKIDPGGYLV